MWNYSNNSAQTTLTASVSSGAASISVGSTSGLPASYPYSLVLDYEQANAEVVTVTGAAGTTLTVTRGEDGTSATSHNIGAVVVHAVVARDVREPQQHIAASGDVHGVGASAAVVGTTSTQTLTNKTISGSANTVTNVPATALVGALQDATVQGSAVSEVPLTVAGRAGQTADLQRWEDSTGTAATRINAAGELVVDQVRTDGSMGIAGDVTAVGNVVVTGNLATAGGLDAFGRFNAASTGVVSWGSGSAAADTNLYRFAANTLKTDDSLDVSGGISVGGALAVGGAATVAGALTVTGLVKGKVAQAIVLRPAAQSIASGGVGSTLSFTSEEVDTATMVDLAGSATNVVIPFNGTYSFVGAATFEAAGTGVRAIGIAKNGTIIVEQKRDATGQADPLSVGIERLCVAGDIITMYAFHTQGSALNISSVTLAVRNTGV